jgi:hypothetical protein
VVSVANGNWRVEPALYWNIFAIDAGSVLVNITGEAGEGFKPGSISYIEETGAEIIGGNVERNSWGIIDLSLTTRDAASEEKWVQSAGV